MAASLRSSVLLTTFLILTVAWESLTTFTIPPHLQHILRHLHQFEKSSSKRFLKRTIVKANGALLNRSLRQVETDVLGRYILMPRAIIDATQLLQEGVNCSSFQVTHKNHFGVEGHLRPTWLHNSTMIGVCPTKYVPRMLRGPLFHRPAEVLEAQCICNNSQCSRDGAKCVALKYRMPVLKISIENRYYTEDDEELTLACVCAKNPSLDGGSIEHNGEEL